MARASSGHAVGGSTTVQSVKIRAEWEKVIEEAKIRHERHFNSREWTEEENAFLVKAREAGAEWRDICDTLKCNQDTARKQWRKLQK